MKNKVYGVFEGSIYEGGGVDGPLYYKKEDAISRALELFEKEEEKWVKVYGRKTDKELVKHYLQYKWRKIDGEDRWANSINEIGILEYEII